MAFIPILVMALALSMDASAVSLAASASGQVTSRRAVFRLAFHFGLFQALMPILGWFLGTTIQPLIASFDHWIAFGLLAIVGIRMLRSGADQSPSPHTSDPSRGWTLVMLSVATSIDAMAVGLSLAMLDISIWLPSAAIGIVTLLVCLGATWLGRCASACLDRRAQWVGGLILIVIAVRIVVSHTA